MNASKAMLETLVYLQLGYRLNQNGELNFDGFNLLESQDSDIDCYYTSHLPGEPAAGVNDMHTHRSEPREFRGGAT